jgi:hypothetical protein
MQRSIETMTTKNPSRDLSAFADHRSPDHEKYAEVSHSAGQR